MLDDISPTAPPEAQAETENERAVVGDNNPPQHLPYDKGVLENLTEKVNNFLKSTLAWIKLEKVETEVQSESLSDQITGLRALYKAVDNQRKAEKTPYDTAGAAVQTAYNPELKKLKDASDALKPKQTAYLAEKKRREDAEKAEAERLARAAAADAAERARLAEVDGDLGAVVDAEQAEKDADTALKRATKPVRAQSRSASGAGRTMSLRTQKFAKIIKINVVLMFYRKHPEVVDLLTRLATADVRKKSYDHEANPVPGIEKQTAA